MAVSEEDRFWSKVDYGSHYECWLWTAARDRGGYGVFGIKRDGLWRSTTAHRYVWELFNGVIPEGIFICHHCDVQHCVNISHLFAGTPQDNMTDKVLKDRQSRGESHMASMPRKLTADQVRAIRADNRFQRDIADDFELHQVIVSKIKTKKIYAWVE